MTHSPKSNIAHAQLLELASMKMPFGKYAGRLLVDLPEPYVVWFAQRGFPKGRLGTLLAIVYEIKVNGLEYLFEPIKGYKQYENETD
ncbi:MAG TPA: hypothetical protein EYG88_04015 [Desulfocapsa sulfexigens]|nr:hypothetical protein [Desulfocapsa sulfexigens]